MRIVLLLVLFNLAAPLHASNTGTNFGGIGIDGIALPGGEILVRQLVAKGPAHLAGIKVGDVITRIDGAATRGSNFQAMVQHRLRGVSGTPVVLVIRRKGADKTLTFALTRRQLIQSSSREK